MITTKEAQFEERERAKKRYREISYPLYPLCVCSVDALFMAARLQREEFHHHYPAIKARLMCYSYLGRILLRCHYFILVCENRIGEKG
jgi:hypothetical protein